MNILTFDIEEWFHILDNESTRTEREWSTFESRLDESLDRILAMLAERKQIATFFCLGWIAKKYPQAIRRIVQYGHDVGTHSHLHQLVYQQSQNDFREDLRRSIHELEDTMGSKVIMYRSPGFSIKKECLWAFDILLEFGIEIDCSVFPASRAHGGLPDFDLSEPFSLKLQNGTIREFPMSIYRIGPLRMVFSGGGYFRLYPYPMIEFLMKRSKYTMTYFHPRDFDPSQPMINGLNYSRKFKSYYGLDKSFLKLTKLIENFPFVSVKEADLLVDWRKAPLIPLNIVS